tara:strand:- start:26093 stop:28651 length:2559 start_codon:yes stop_codon:yes gene_type:complete
LKLKTKPQDFKVTEVLPEGHLQERGEHRVYLVTKTKLTSFEAAEALARAAGVASGDVSMAGLKDRQGVTRQYMSLHRGRDVRIDEYDLKIQTAGYLDEAIQSGDSLGNKFELVVRDLGPSELVHLRKAIDPVRDFGLPNYFDEQRFGNLRHGQGWIALDLIRGDTSGALKRMLCSTSPYDNPDLLRLKQVIWRKWGDWHTCREVAGRLGKHHSVFEHLKRDPEDFAGAFHRVSTRERLIHLYAFQSHIWNRAVANWIDASCPPKDRFAIPSREGKLIFTRGALPDSESWNGTFPLPGPRLEEVQHESQLEFLREALALHHLSPQDFVIDDIPGFGFKHEERPLIIKPNELRVRPAEPDPEHKDRHLVKLSFELPRGAYASLVLRRLLGPLSHADDGDERDGRSRRGRGEGMPRRAMRSNTGSYRGMGRDRDNGGTWNRDHRDAEPRDGGGWRAGSGSDEPVRFRDDDPRRHRDTSSYGAGRGGSRGGGSRRGGSRRGSGSYSDRGQSGGGRSYEREERPRDSRYHYNKDGDSGGGRPRGDRDSYDRSGQDRPQDSRYHYSKDGAGSGGGDRGQGDRPSYQRDDGDRPRRDDRYSTKRDDGDRPRQDDRYSYKRDGGDRPQRDDRYSTKRDDGDRPQRDDRFSYKRDSSGDDGGQDSRYSFKRGDGARSGGDSRSGGGYRSRGNSGRGGGSRRRGGSGGGYGGGSGGSWKRDDRDDRGGGGGGYDAKRPWRASSDDGGGGGQDRPWRDSGSDSRGSGGYGRSGGGGGGGGGQWRDDNRGSRDRDSRGHGSRDHGSQNRPWKAEPTQDGSPDRRVGDDRDRGYGGGSSRRGSSRRRGDSTMSRRGRGGRGRSRG